MHGVVAEGSKTYSRTEASAKKQWHQVPNTMPVMAFGAFQHCICVLGGGPNYLRVCILGSRTMVLSRYLISKHRLLDLIIRHIRNIFGAY